MADEVLGIPLTALDITVRPVIRSSEAPARNVACAVDCNFTCDQVFGTLDILPTIDFGTLIQWTLHPLFSDPGPYTYQLQAGRTGNPDADDWEPVGFDADNVFYLIDDTKRVYGMTQWTHYRVMLTTELATYFSPPISALDAAGGVTDQRTYLAMLKAQARQIQAQGSRGYLLKRRTAGARCPNCIDTLTGDVTGDCDLCYGVGWVGGYYTPMPCVWLSRELMGSRSHVHAAGRGTIDDKKRTLARMLAIPQLFTGDVWVDEQSDLRFFMHDVDEAAAWRGRVIAYNVAIRQLPFTDPVYRFEIAAQLPTPRS
jgi:hypothetical protein